MIKNILSVIAVAGALALASCSSEPSDLRPGAKVSTDTVPPGTRNNTSNIDSEDDAAKHRQDVQVNHDEHATDIDTKTQGTPAHEETKKKEAVENHN
ncbi:hypothetical protein TH61_06055 [Rufibacter sp. DG15C]|uniref:hypothetical protein n=1 Tax=Rufibacter sp. DG15C TaxID=1379909 RepID=UPI00078D349E|nr:hypothetical protein [Rufibacter sp. DG15C]AMM50829.1 hypothetical protein TH61_06055 [Rufibacter sp. DG15C]